MNIDFHSHFSDDSTYNATNTCEHMKKYSHWMYEVFFHKGLYNILYYIWM